MNIEFRKLSQEHALMIANQWHYDNEYSFYDMSADPEDYEEFINEHQRNKNDYYEAIVHEQCIGFFCIIPEGNELEIGLGLRPDICGKGKGKTFLNQIIAFIQQNYFFENLIMNVAVFNQRAIKVYRACGFRDGNISLRETNGGTYEFMNMKRSRQCILAERLKLERIDEQNQNEMLELLTNDQIKKTYMLPDFRSKEKLMNLFHSFIELSKDTKRFVRGIYLHDKLIGFINDVEIKDDRIELGYVIHPDYWNQGYASEALASSIQHLLKQGFKKIITGAFEENKASQRVMEKCGMVKTDLIEKVEYRNQIHRCIMYIYESE